MYILILILVLFIASIVAAYFGARTWHWAHVILVVAIFMATVGFFILAAETLRINAILRTQANQLEAELNQVNARIDGLERGTGDSQVINELAADEVQILEAAEEIPSLADLDHRLHLATRLRGRVWRKVVPAGFDPQTDTVVATIESPQPSGVEPDTILFLFELGEPTLPDPTRGPQYLGEFRVREVAGQQVSLVAVNQLDDFERQRLAASQGPWALHETMPIDQHELFAGLSEEELRKLLPEESVTEYIRQGTPAGPDDDEWHRAGFDEEGKPLGPDDIDKAAKVLYERRLRDYSLEFAEMARRRVVLLANIAAVTNDNQRLKAALASAEKLRAFREEELRKLGIDLAGVTKERTIIETHLATVERQLANAQQLLGQSLAENRRLADELARLQAQWGELLEERSSTVPADGPLALSQ